MTPDPWPAPRARGPLEAVVPLPGSKSVTNRMLVQAEHGPGGQPGQQGLQQHARVHGRT